MIVNGEKENSAEISDKHEAKLSEGEEADDDDYDVVLRDIRATPSYNSNLHIKRGNLLTLTKVRTLN